MPAVVRLLGDQLRHRIDLVKMTLTQSFQTVTECTGEAVQHPVFDVPVFNDIGSVRCDLVDHLQILRILLDIFPERFFVPGIRRQPESRRARIPFEAVQIVVISLGRKKIGKEHMPQLMCKHTAHELIPILASFDLGHQRMPRVDTDLHIVRCRREGILWFPVQVHTDATVVMIPSGLCCCQILKMPRQHTGGKELFIRDFTAFLVETLFD